MKLLAQPLTALLAFLLITVLPVAAPHCCDFDSCCPPGDCECRLNAAPTAPPTTETPATIPGALDTFATTPSTFSGAGVPPLATVPFRLTLITAAFAPPPLYALTHSYLI